MKYMSIKINKFIEIAIEKKASNYILIKYTAEWYF